MKKSTARVVREFGPFAGDPKIGGVTHDGKHVWAAMGDRLQAIDPETGEFVSADVAEQTEQVFKNLIAVLEAAGAGLENVVKTTVFLADMGEFSVMNDVYARYFVENKPARATVQAARLPRDARVEIECIAVV